MTNQPSFIAYSVKDRSKDKADDTTPRTGEKPAIWTKIGAVFPHKGTGFTIFLDALPLGDRIVLREPKDDKADGQNGGARE